MHKKFLWFFLFVLILVTACEQEISIPENQGPTPTYEKVIFPHGNVKPGSVTLTISEYDLKPTESYVYWESDDSNIVDVSQYSIYGPNQCTVEYKNYGDTTVYLKTNEERIIAEWPISVTISSFELSLEYADLEYGATWQLGVTSNPSNIPIDTFTFSSSNEDAVAVSASGLIEVVGYGNSIITVYHKSDVSIVDSLLVRVVGYPDSFAGGTGTLADPYIIETPTQMVKISESLGSHYKLLNDIDLSGYSAGSGWIPIGNYITPFTGTFDGADFKILNLHQNYSNEDVSYIGLFGVISSAEISNIEFINSDITSLKTMGTVAGYVMEDSLITNCKVTGNIRAEYGYRQSQQGGIVGLLVNSTLDNCVFNGEIDSSGYSFNYNLGGLVGKSESSIIQDCKIDSLSLYHRTTGESKTGGLVGSASSTTISDCTISADITGYSEYAGGLVGEGLRLTITNSNYSGTIEGKRLNGGIAARISHSTITDSFAHSEIFPGYGEYNAYYEGSGGFVGSTYLSTFMRCSSNSTIVSNQNWVGGFAGILEIDSIVENCYAIADVSGADYVGGFAGESNGVITNSFSSAQVVGNTTNIGGFVGKNTGTLTSVYYDKDISGYETSTKGTPLTTIDMKRQSSYIGWDFINIWEIEETVDYPNIRSE